MLRIALVTLIICISCSAGNFVSDQSQSYCLNLEFLEEKQVRLDFGPLNSSNNEIPIKIVPTLEILSPDPIGASFKGTVSNNTITFRQTKFYARDPDSGRHTFYINGDIQFTDDSHDEFIATITANSDPFKHPRGSWKLRSYGQRGSCPSTEFTGNSFPQLVHNNFIDMRKIKKISKFRSSAGHSYTDNAESCRSMKHYYETIYHNPKDAAAEAIKSPIDGKVVYIFDSLGDNFGQDIVIQSSVNTAFKLRIFHLTTLPTIKPGDHVSSGQLIGHLFSDNAYRFPSIKSTKPRSANGLTLLNQSDLSYTTDIALYVRRPEGVRLESFLNILDQHTLNNYQQNGVPMPWRPSLYLDSTNLQISRYRCRDIKDPARFTHQELPDASNYLILQ